MALIPLRFKLRALWSALAFLCRLRFRAKPFLADDTACQSGNFIVSGFFNQGLGIGRAGDLTASALRAADLDLEGHTLRHLFRHTVFNHKSLNGAHGVWLIHANAPEAMMALLAHEPATWMERYRIAYWAWETPQIPPSWACAVPYFHEIWVPSAYVFEAVAAGLKKIGQDSQIQKLKIMPHPVAIRPLPPPDKGRFGLDLKVHNFLCLFDCDSSVQRKNPWAALEAWTRAFETSSLRARLYIKVSGKHGRDEVVHHLQTLCAQRSDIYMVHERFEDDVMDQFLASFDGLISLHRSEGFGLSLAEALRAGLIVIATAGTGNDDFMNSDNSLCVPFTHVPLKDETGPYGSVAHLDGQIWCEPDIAFAAKSLQEIVENWPMTETITQMARIQMQNLPKAWRKENLSAMKFWQYIRSV